MAKNDMEVIIYKILRYLYDSNKSGKVPTFSDMFTVLELPTIPQSYLAQVIQELIDDGYIAGCNITDAKGGMIFTLQENARITLEGVNYLNYLNEDSRMKTAASTAGEAFEILLSAIISAAFSRQN